MAHSHGEAPGRYAAANLDTLLPWTKMRQVYRLLAHLNEHWSWTTDHVKGEGSET